MSAGDHVKTLVESLQELLQGHLRLFKVELAEDAKVIGVQVGKIAAFVPLLLVGYLFLCAALALFLGRYIGWDLAFLAVALANLLGGGIGIALAARALKERKVLDGTQAELQASSTAISHAVRAQQEPSRG